MITPSFGLTATERVLPKLALDFTTAGLDPRVTLTRALNTATAINSSGNVAVVNADLPRFDYNPTTLVCKGLLIEESRINSLRNNTMAGAAAGSPGTAPTYWGYLIAGAGTTRTIATGTENGIAYIDITIAGTSTTAYPLNIAFESSTAVAALTGQNWSSSVYCKLVSGSLSGISVGFNLAENTAAGGYVAGGGITIAPTTSSLISQRFTYSRTLSGGATVGALQPTMLFTCTAGATVNFTIRIGLPQLELGAFATSVIQTSSGAVTRNADVATMTGTNFSSWFNATQGSFVTTFDCGYPIGAGTGIAVLADTAAVIWPTYIHTTGKAAMYDGTNLALTTGSVPSYPTVSKIAARYGSSEQAVSLNGSTRATSASAGYAGLSGLRLGSAISNIVPLCGHIQKMFYYSVKFTDNEMKAFSA
jgi:hypothetical protein